MEPPIAVGPPSGLQNLPYTLKQFLAQDLGTRRGQLQMGPAASPNMLGLNTHSPRTRPIGWIRAMAPHRDRGHLGFQKTLSRVRSLREKNRDSTRMLRGRLRLGARRRMGTLLVLPFQPLAPARAPLGSPKDLPLMGEMALPATFATIVPLGPQEKRKIWKKIMTRKNP